MRRPIPESRQKQTYDDTCKNVWRLQVVQRSNYSSDRRPKSATSHDGRTSYHQTCGSGRQRTICIQVRPADTMTHRGLLTSSPSNALSGMVPFA